MVWVRQVAKVRTRKGKIHSQWQWNEGRLARMPLLVRNDQSKSFVEASLESDVLECEIAQKWQDHAC